MEAADGEAEVAEWEAPNAADGEEEHDERKAPNGEREARN